jgi:hypothetical protein
MHYGNFRKFDEAAQELKTVKRLNRTKRLASLASNMNARGTRKFDRKPYAEQKCSRRKTSKMRPENIFRLTQY